MQLTQSLHKGVRERPEAPATVCGTRRHTYRELHERVARLAAGLRAQGLRPGDRVGILGVNSDYYLEAIYAVLWAGGVINPVNSRWAPPEMAYSLDDCQTRMLMVDQTFADAVEPLREQSGVLETVLHMGDGEAPDGVTRCEALIEQCQAVEDAGRRGDDLAGVMYTGGTTGAPKGVMLSHANLYADVLGTLAASPRPDRPVALQAAPFFHVGGLGLILQVAARLGTHVIMPGFEPGAVLALVERERIQETFLVPTMLRMVLDHEDFSRHDLSSLRCLIYGASPMDGGLMDRALAQLPNAEFLQVYGMTELAPVVAALPPWYHTPEGRRPDKLAAAGMPINIAELRIVDGTDRELPPGETGEIAVRGPMVMQGYWNKPEQTAAALRGGWMHTGDAGYLDEDGFLFVVDRVKDMIISGGENVYSAEVEEAILRLPQVRQCAVIGVPDEQWGERVHAVVVLQEGEQLEHDELLAHCRTLIASYKCPRSSEQRPELPVSAAGKLLKYKLREGYWEGRSRGMR